MIQTVNKNDVMQMTGLPKTQAQNLIKQAKLQMVKKVFNGTQINELHKYQLKLLRKFLDIKSIPKMI